MTDVDALALAARANVALYACMAVLACAMIAFAVLAGARTGRGRGVATVDTTPTPVLASVGAAAGAETSPAAGAESAASVAETADLQPTPADDATPTPRRGFAARAGQWGISLTWVAFFLLLSSQVMRGMSVGRAPVANMFEFACSAVLMLLGGYLVWGLRRPLQWLGLFVTLPSLLTLGLALTVWYTPAAELQPALKSVWIVIHVPVAIASVAVFGLAFACVLLQQLRRRHEESLAAGADNQWTRPGALSDFYASLPTAAHLDKLSHALHVVGFILWTFTLIAGAIWAQVAWGTYWNWDPKETWTFVIWILYAAYLHARATSGLSERTVFVLACLGFVAIIINFTVVNMVFPGQHSYSGL